MITEREKMLLDERNALIDRLAEDGSEVGREELEIRLTKIELELGL